MGDEIKVDGFPLPEYLVELISQGRWKTPSDTTPLKQLTGFKGNTDIDLLSVENMSRVNRNSDLIDDPNIARIYGLASSSRTGQEITNAEILDVDKAIYIAMNWDEEAICLDYRPGLDKPRVVCTVLERRAPMVWKTIAEDFKQFADYLGL